MKNVPIRCIVVSRSNGSVAVVQRAVKVFSNKYKVKEASESKKFPVEKQSNDNDEKVPVDTGVNSDPVAVENTVEQPVSAPQTKESAFAETLGDAIKIIIFPKDDER